jgi:hypothetical protein
MPANKPLRADRRFDEVHSMTFATDPDRPAATAHADGEQEHGDSRREALKRLGKYGAYTAPFLIAIISSEAAAQGASNQ